MVVVTEDYEKDKMVRTIELLQDRITDLEEALKPFTDRVFINEVGDYRVTGLPYALTDYAQAYEALHRSD